MTIQHVLAVFLFLMLTSFFMLSQDPYRPSRGEELVNMTLSKTMKTLKNKYKLRPAGSGAAMPGGPIQKLTLCFDAKNLTKEKLRELLIKFAQELLDQVIANEEMQQFLAIKPFTIKNIQIMIFNHDSNNRELYDPGISTAEISNGILTYQTTDRNETCKYKNEFTETYEEALQALSEASHKTDE
jgi:hypothetical protein